MYKASKLPIMILLLPIWGMGGFWNGVKAQDTQVLDSLKTLLQESRPDTNRVNLFIELGRVFIYSNSDSAIQYSQKAVVLAQQLRFTRGESYALSFIAFSEREKANYAEALLYAQQALKVATKGNHPLEKGQAYLRLAGLFALLHYLEESLDFYKNAENIFLQLNDQERLAVVYGNTGGIYSNEATLVNEQVKKDSLLRLALPYFEKALAINRAIKRKSGIVTTLQNIVETYESLNQDSMAFSYLPEAMRMAEEAGNLKEIYRFKSIKARLLLKRGQIEEAENLALGLPEDEKKLLGKPTDVLLYKLLSDLYVQKKDYVKAYQYRLIYHELRDKFLYNPEAIKAAQQLRKDLEAEKEAAVRSQVEKERQIQQLWFFSALGAFLSVTPLVFFLYRNNRNKQKANKLLQQQTEEIFRLNNHLEDLVVERTHQLKQRNSQLEEYAFFNAHKLRGPVSSIMGIYNLLKEETNPQEQSMLLDYLNQLVMELDTVVRKIQGIVDDE